MIVRVKLFAVAKDLAGSDCVAVELPDQATVGQLRMALAAQYPQLAQLSRQVLFAVEMQYVADSATVPPQAEVACVPPVSGG